MSRPWHLVTGEFSPTLGGLADYTRQVAAGLAARGALVHVWSSGHGGTTVEHGVTVHRTAGTWSAADRSRVAPALAAAGAGRVLVQWVPHAFGQRSLNVGFCHWVRGLVARGHTLEVMVHEPSLGFMEGSLRQDAAAVVHRWMLVILLRQASRAWLATPAWQPRIRPWLLGRTIPLKWLPVPSNVEVVDSPGAVLGLRERYAPDGSVLLGHFGTYGGSTRAQLEAALPEVLRGDPELRVLLVGRDSEPFAAWLAAAVPHAASRLSATGELPHGAVSCALQACDVLLQPYADGASTRRGTLMAALAHGRPIVTTLGRLSEPFWREEDGRSIVTAPVADPRRLARAALDLARDRARGVALGCAARDLYDSRFALRHTIDALLQPQGAV